MPSLRPLYASVRASVAPLRWGAGVKGKVNEAHMLGVPVACTSVAAAGMHAEHREHVLIGDTPRELADAVNQLHNNETLWRHLVHRGRQLVATRFSVSRAARGLSDTVAELRAHSLRMRLRLLAADTRDKRLSTYADLRDMAATDGRAVALDGVEPWQDLP
jgi:glycosyltransferase involved in cell wall biosynthesis